MIRSLLVVGCTSETPHGRHALGRLLADAAARDIPVVGLDKPAALATSWTPAGLTSTIACDWSDASALHDLVADKQGCYSAVLTHRELCVWPTAVLAEGFGVAGNAPAAVKIIQNKDMCRSIVRGAGLPQPEVLRFDGNPDRAPSAVRGVLGEPPWVVKPRVGVGSDGVIVVHDQASLPNAVRSSRHHGPVLIEQFVQGEEYSCEGVMQHGGPTVLAVTRKSIDSGCVETGHRVPAQLDPNTTSALMSALRTALAATGITTGLFHIEFWLNPTVVLGEIHARPGGDFIHALIEASRPGLQLFGALIDDLLSIHPLQVPEQSRAAGSEYLTFPEGTLRAVHGWDAATEYLLASHLFVKPGDRLSPPHSSEGRHAVLVAEGDTLAHVESQLRTAASALEVDLA